MLLPFTVLFPAAYGMKGRRNILSFYLTKQAWWFPENKYPGHGWDESNINILTSNAYEDCDPAMGATHVRTLLCKISPEGDKGRGSL